MTSALNSAAYFLISFLVGTYIYLLLLRLLMQYFGANYYNPISQWIIKLSEPLLKPMRRVIPGYKGIDFAIVVWLLILQGIALLILMALRTGEAAGFMGLVIITIVELFDKLIDVFFFATIIAAIISWFPKLQTRNPVAEIVYLIAGPLLVIARRFIPLIAGFDLSPIVVIIVLKLISIVVFSPLLSLGLRLAFT